MKDNPQQLIVILGPTATGKSDLSVKLAKQFDGEVISADSRQVYRGMNIGTGKITKKEMRGVPHHLLDIASPKSGNYNAAKFQKDAIKKIEEIAKRGKIPFLVGGTGFWIDAVAKSQVFPDVKPNPILRKKLAHLNAEKLFSQLQKLDPNRALNIDKNNRVRLIRAIEIAKAKPSKSKVEVLPEFSVLYLGLNSAKDVLDKKIEKRLLKRIKQGMLAEVKKLHAQGVSWKKLESFGLEYRSIAKLLQNKISKDEMVTELSAAIKNYAKRQKTWFKSNKEIIWFDPDKKTTAKLAAAKIKKFLST